jgi:DNA-cytosine methyltransferase
VVRPNEKGGAGYLGYEDKTFTIATSPDQWICTPLINPSPQPNPMNEPAQPAPVGKPIRYLSVCSGMEAASVAWHPLGWTPVGFSEIEPFPCAILKHRFPNTPNYGSLTEYTSWPLEPGAIDLLVGGTPCQSFSVAGLRKGLTDPRGNLALTFLGLADKLKPRWIVWENVPGVLSSNGGRDFGSFVGALGQLGYGWAMRILDAQHFGVPQRRRRVFVVACLGDWRAPAEVLSLREGLRGYLETGNKKRKSVTPDAGASAAAGRWLDGGQVSQTLDAVLAKGQTMPEKNRFPAVLTPVVIDRAAFNQGQNAQYEPHIGESEVMDTLVSKGPHAVGVPFRKSKRACSTTDNETLVPADASNTLNNFDLGDTRTTHAVVQHQMPGSVAPTIGASGPPYSRTGNERVEAEALAITFAPHIVQASELRLRGQITEQDTCPTLLANTKSGDNDPLAVQAITFQPGNLRREAGADPSFTTTTTLKASAGDQTPHVAYPVVPLDGMNLLSRLGDCGEKHSMQNFDNGDPSFTLRKGGSQHGVLTPMAVRRLTPNECYRLQGFPDNWGNIPWKGKPEGQAPDGPQYKAAGNSMAVPCMRWIGERIAAVDAALSR